MYIVSISLISRHAMFFVVGFFSLLVLLPIYGYLVSGNTFPELEGFITASVFIAVFMSISNIFNGFKDYIILGNNLLEL